MKSAPRNLPIRARRPRRNRLPDNLPVIAQPELRRAIAEHRAVGRAARVAAAGRGRRRGGGGGGGGGGRGLGGCGRGSCGRGGCHGGVGERGGYGHERRHGRGRSDGRGAGGAGREDAAWVAGWDGRRSGGLDGGGLDNGSRGLGRGGGGRAAGCGCAAAGDGFATGGTGRGLVLRGRLVGEDVLAGVGEQHVEVWRALAVDRGDVGDKHIRELVELGCVASTACDRDRSTVHVQLRPTAQPGKPSPREGDLPVRDAVWDLEAEVFGPVDAWAASFHGHDDLELGVGSWDLVSCDAELAASPSVNCGTLKRQSLSISNFHVVHL